MTDVEPQITEKSFVPASVATTFPSVARIDTSEQLEERLSFTWDNIEALATAMFAQGPWFMGHDVRSPESAFKVARDILVSLELMGFEIIATEPLAPERNEDGPQELAANVTGSEWR